MLTVCCVCNRMEHHNSWNDLQGETVKGDVSHGYCPDCFSNLMAELSMSLPGWNCKERDNLDAHLCDLASVTDLTTAFVH